MASEKHSTWRHRLGDSRSLWIKCLERELTHSWDTSQVKKQRPHMDPGKWNYLMENTDPIKEKSRNAQKPAKDS